ncbi:MAG: phosphodiester glycosidase family protein [Spirochaetales bacterium]|nr:phosphodiester glycosidase family protein [Spirochaetales bacterium]
MKSHKTALSVLLILSALLVSCASVPPEIPEGGSLMPPEISPVWNETDVPGLQILSEAGAGQPVGGAVLQLELKYFDFFLTPPDPSGKGETRSLKTSEFAEFYDLLIAANASPYADVDLFNRSDRPMDIVGLQINAGESVSEAVPHYDALYILDDGQVMFSSQETIPAKTSQALGGFHLLLRAGENLGMDGKRHPRTAVGLSRDGKRFIIAVFDGRQANRAGLSTRECAAWMQWLGAYDALNLDGGGSSTLVFNEKGTVRVLNSPIHRGKPGLERAVANHLGFRRKVP